MSNTTSLCCATDNQEKEERIDELYTQYSLIQLIRSLGWKNGIFGYLKDYFPHYTVQTGDTVNIDERPNWYQCILYALQHLLAMFSNVVIIPLLLGYDPSTSLFFSGLTTICFFLVTAGRIPSYLGCSGSFTSIILSLTEYQYSSSLPLNTNTKAVQGALLILSILYVAVSIFIMIFGYLWLEVLMPPVVTGAIIISIGCQLFFISYKQITSTNFDIYMALLTAMAIIMVRVYSPSKIVSRMSILVGVIIGYMVHAICGVKGAGYLIDFNRIGEAAWIKAPSVKVEVEFSSNALCMIVPLLIVLLAENLGHMKAIESITKRPVLRFIGRAYLGDAMGCLISSLCGSLPQTTYAENIAILSVTKIYSPLVIVCAAILAVLFSFLAKFSAVVESIPQGVLGGVTLILYTLLVMTGVRIWVANRVDFNDSRNIFSGGIPIALAIIIREPIEIGYLYLDGIGAATFSCLILYQLLMGTEMIRRTVLSYRNKLSAHST
ncbi:uracil-xanthine permease [Pilobolus umbonatus]|nr:uracil-xanthine permease [Pilobolus umbonatus]